MRGLHRRLGERFRAAGRARSGHSGMGGVAMLLAALAAVAPLLAGSATPTVVGLALLTGACLELAHGVRRSTTEGRRAAWIGGAITLAMGVVVLQAGDLVGRAIMILLAVWFGVDALRYALGRAAGSGPGFRARALPALGYGLLAVLLLLVRGSAVRWAIAAAAAFRLAGTAWSIVTAPAYTHADTGDTVAQDLDLADSPALADLARRLATEEQGRAGIDRGWIWRLRGHAVRHPPRPHGLRPIAPRHLLAASSPSLGDLFLALVIAFGVVDPRCACCSGRLTPRARAARVALVPGRRASGAAGARAPVRAVLDHRLRFAVRLRAARYSAPDRAEPRPPDRPAVARPSWPPSSPCSA